MKQQSTRNWPWSLVQFAGWLLASALLVVTLLLCWRLGQAATLSSGTGNASVVAANISAPSPAVSRTASGTTASAPTMNLTPEASTKTVDTSSGSKPSEDGSKDAVANAMTAIGTAVAVITLVLTLGIPWFYERLKEINLIRKEIEETGERLDQKYAQSIALTQQQIEHHQALLVLQQQLLIAKSVVLHWAFQNEITLSAAGLAQKVGLQLEALMSNDDLVRRQAFGELILWPWNPEIMAKGQALPLQLYQEACHIHHAKRLGIPSDRALTQRGLWCLFWNESEITVYENSAVRTVSDRTI